DQWKGFDRSAGGLRISDIATFETFGWAQQSGDLFRSLASAYPSEWILVLCGGAEPRRNHQFTEQSRQTGLNRGFICQWCWDFCAIARRWIDCATAPLSARASCFCSVHRLRNLRARRNIVCRRFDRLRGWGPASDGPAARQL